MTFQDTGDEPLLWQWATHQAMAEGPAEAFGDSVGLRQGRHGSWDFGAVNGRFPKISKTAEPLEDLKSFEVCSSSSRAIHHDVYGLQDIFVGMYAGKRCRSINQMCQVYVCGISFVQPITDWLTHCGHFHR
jgi:hypothetical protein